MSPFKRTAYSLASERCMVSDVQIITPTTSTDTLFYNIKRTHSSTTSNSASVSTTGSGNTGVPITLGFSKSSNAAAIGGGVAGFVVIATILGFTFFRRRKQAVSNTVTKESTCNTLALPADFSNAPSPAPRPLQMTPSDTRASYVTAAYSTSISHTNTSSPFLTARCTSSFRPFQQQLILTLPLAFRSMGSLDHGTKAELETNPHAIAPSGPQLYGYPPQQHHQSQEQ
ncbi:hypothetical protein BGZ95_002765 [Linnemannia exigua]|uniref:Uncharacterized protein n=1 Tax=Linnemannia exigua TaxID=604196 RepID=A0AAD4DND0_9FUNG|nr:hypothetical protein BGZ95_002765 [Linnemannia exigua]